MQMENLFSLESKYIEQRATNPFHTWANDMKEKIGMITNSGLKMCCVFGPLRKPPKLLHFFVQILELLSGLPMYAFLCFFDGQTYYNS